MLNILAFSYNGVSSLTPYCSKMLEIFIIMIIIFLSHSLLCRASLHCFPLSFPFSFSMPLRLSLTLDLHFNNGERHDDEDGTAIAIFPGASSKVSWTCASSMVSDAMTRMVPLVPHWT